MGWLHVGQNAGTKVISYSKYLRSIRFCPGLSCNRFLFRENLRGKIQSAACPALPLDKPGQAGPNLFKISTP